MEVIVVSLALLSVMLGVNLQVPMYDAYSAEWGGQEGLSALLFATYVFGLIPVLIAFGGISDRIGSKKTLMLALVSGFCANSLMLFEPSIITVFFVRILQGASVALVLGASAIFFLSRLNDAALAANLHGILVTLGLGSGALLTSASLVLLESVTPVSYWVITFAGVLCFALMLRISDTAVRNNISFLRLPIINRDTWLYCLFIFAGWSLTGVMIAVVPGVISTNATTGMTGWVVFLAVATGTLVQPLSRKRSLYWGLAAGCVIGAFSVGLLVVSIASGSSTMTLLAAAFAGVSSLGFIYIGGLKAVIEQPELIRARSIAGYFVCGYIGLGLPCTVVGYGIQYFGILTALSSYGIFLISLLLIGLFLLTERRHRKKIELVEWY